MTGAMHTAAQSLPSAILALLPSPHLRDSLKALRFLLLQGQDSPFLPPYGYQIRGAGVRRRGRVRVGRKRLFVLKSGASYPFP